ncbi:MAG: glycogen debranching enzyme N-terminal domain-containing protein [Methanosarcinaceae archaeon]|nr:glycogen debranching enzyme N-terminal domain-containing protein [Methanosarcinaceae archaeon]
MSRAGFSYNGVLDYEHGIQKEWITTNGLGGYASSTIIGANSRTYHGLLVAALNPPVDRTVLLSSIDEEIIVGEKIFRLSTHKYPNTVYPTGFEYLKQFSVDPFPTSVYQIGDMEIVKRVFMVYGQNTTVIKYEVNNGGDSGDDDGSSNVILRLYPLISMRNFHHTIRSNNVGFAQDASEYETTLTANDVSLSLTSNARYSQGGTCFYNLEYDTERSRGQAYQEDNYNSGFFEIKLKKGVNNIFVVASVDEISPMKISDVEELYEEALVRLSSLEDKTGLDDDFVLGLIPAADSFIVNRASTGSRTIIAGYHWFSDWGRDAMISLPGLTLVTGRFEDAAQILLSFAKNCKDGLIPNRFADLSDQKPDYNTVDASLWFVHAVGKYFAYTKDVNFVRKMWDTVDSIIRNYMNGTHFDIHMDADGLITHGSQLTWMDAKIGDFEVTPRRGKACEINALWYNALKTASHLAEHLQKDTSFYDRLADDVKQSYAATFWNSDEECLFDCVDGNISGSVSGSVDAGKSGMVSRDASIRPNQILAVSLPYTMLSREMEIDIVNRVERDLLTPVGLRTLAMNDPLCKKLCDGDMIARDMAYHNGTVWAWLMGPYVSAYTKVNNHSKESREHTRAILLGLREHLQDGGIGTISEIFDGDAPHKPRGCISQAWSVAEVLRAYVEDVVRGVNGEIG